MKDVSFPRSAWERDVRTADLPSTQRQFLILFTRGLKWGTPSVRIGVPVRSVGTSVLVLGLPGKGVVLALAG
jgi:hypothetical protein